MKISKNYIIFIIILAKLIATALSLYVVDNITPLVDAKMYQEEKYFDHNIPFRTYLVQLIASITNHLTSPTISHFVFSFFSISGILWYIRLYNFSWHILFILLLPSSMIWTSIISKEAVYYCLFSLLLINWNIFINNKLTKVNFIIIFIASLLCLILRPHYFICLLWLFWSAIILIYFKRYKLILIISFLIICSIISIIFHYGDFLDNFFKIYFFDVVLKGYESIDPNGSASRHKLLELVMPPNLCQIEMCSFASEKEFLLENYSKYFSLGFLFGIIGPLPIEIVQRPEFIPFFFEGIIILLFPFVFFIFCKIKFKFFNDNIYFRNYLYGIIPAILLVMAIHAYFGILNPGTAIRWRINFELIFYFAPYLIYLNLKELKK